MKRPSVDIDEESSKRLKISHNTTIEHLPGEVLEKIFQKFSAHERRTLMTVQKRWLAVLQEYFPQDNSLILSEDMDFTLDGVLYRTLIDKKGLVELDRTFPYIVIKSFPKTFTEFFNLTLCLKQIRHQIKSLTIQQTPKFNFPKKMMNTLFYLTMPHLQKLIISDDFLLGNQKFPKELTTIELQNVLHDTKFIDLIRQHENMTTFTCKAIQFNKSSVNGKFLSAELRKELEIICTKNEVETEVDFNFCAESQLDCGNITSLRFEKVIKSPLTNLSSFENLKNLYIHVNSYHFSENEISFILPGTYKGVKHIELSQDYKFENNLQDIFESFPDCEYLQVKNFPLYDGDFASICSSMPKLKVLILLGDGSDVQITFDALLDRQEYSLKDLVMLEEFFIHTSNISNWEEDEEDFFLEWPKLPHLHTLSLISYGLTYLQDQTFVDIVKNCPKLRNLRLDSQYSSFKFPFLPMIATKNCLTSLYLCGKPDELFNKICEHLHFLEHLTIYHVKGLSLKEEYELFARIKSLKTVKSIFRADSQEFEREITRENYENIQSYLRENLKFYPDWKNTANYVANYMISFNTKMEMMKKFWAEHPNENESDVRKLYLLTTFLDMDILDVCRLIAKSPVLNCLN